MIDELFRLAADFAYGGFIEERERERRRAAAAFRKLQEDRAREYERRVLVGLEAR